MERYKRVITIILIFVLALFSLFGCGNVTQKENSEKIKVVTTIFPPYDFVREIAGDTVELTMLLKPGMESHSYEPSPSDILKIQESDIFIYNGGESDVWVDHILSSIDNKDLHTVKMMDYVDNLEEEIVPGMEAENDGEDGEEYDEHVWTSPKCAVEIVKAISKTLLSVSPQYEDIYAKNTAEYIEKLNSLDAKFRGITENSKRKTILFGDRFPFRYLTKEYNLSYSAAFPGCSSESEAGAQTVAFLIDKVKEEEIPTVFYLEFSTHKIADTIVENTDAKAELLHSCHNLSKTDMENNVTYLELMNRNCDLIREALN